MTTPKATRGRKAAATRKRPSAIPADWKDHIGPPARTKRPCCSMHVRTWKLADGGSRQAYEVRWRDPDGVHRGRTFRKISEAKTFKSNVLRGTHVPPAQRVKFSDLVRAFDKHTTQRWRVGLIGESAMRGLCGELKRHILPEFGRRKLDEIAKADVDQFAMQMLESGRAVSSVRSSVMLISRVFAFGIDAGMSVRDPTAGVLKGLSHLRTPRVRSFTRQEVGLLMAEIERMSDGDPYSRAAWSKATTRAAVYLAAFCGLRYGEIAGLCFDSVDLEAGQIKVQRSYSQLAGLKKPKTEAGLREIPLPALVIDALRELVRLSPPRGKHKQLLFRSVLKQSPLEGCVFHRSIWGPLLNAAGLSGPDDKGRNFHFHALRHFAASSMISAGSPLTDVAASLGHTSGAFTLKTYGHALGSREDRLRSLESIVHMIPVLQIEEAAHGQRR